VFNYVSIDRSVIYLSCRKQKLHLISGYTSSQLLSGVDDNGKYFQKKGKKNVKDVGNKNWLHTCVSKLRLVTYF